jgi:exodeoxyribonuclease-3
VRIVTWNLNGIRAAHRKGLDGFLNKIDADIWLFQEVRALLEQDAK